MIRYYGIADFLVKYQRGNASQGHGGDLTAGEIAVDTAFEDACKKSSKMYKEVRRRLSTAARGTISAKVSRQLVTTSRLNGLLIQYALGFNFLCGKQNACKYAFGAEDEVFGIGLTNPTVEMLNGMMEGRRRLIKFYSDANIHQLPIFCLISYFSIFKKFLTINWHESVFSIGN